jgi:hypothetical protein
MDALDRLLDGARRPSPPAAQIAEAHRRPDLQEALAPSSEARSVSRSLRRRP